MAPASSACSCFIGLSGLKSYWQVTPEPEGYSIGAFVVQRDLNTIPDEAPVELRRRLEPNLLNRLTETQKIEHTSIGAILRCSIEDTRALRLFLLSNADEIEVLEPHYLRDHIRDTLRRALDMYASDKV